MKRLLPILCALLVFCLLISCHAADPTPGGMTSAESLPSVEVRQDAYESIPTSSGGVYNEQGKQMHTNSNVTNSYDTYSDSVSSKNKTGIKESNSQVNNNNSQQSSLLDSDVSDSQTSSSVSSTTSENRDELYLPEIP